MKLCFLLEKNDNFYKTYSKRYKDLAKKKGYKVVKRIRECESFKFPLLPYSVRHNWGAQ